MLDTPVMTPQGHHRVLSASSSKKERSKPANLKLSGGYEKPQSKTASLLSALRSPRKKAVKGVNISSPIMTPQSSTFPRQEPQEMNPMSPRHYAPPPPPPIPTDQISFGASRVSRNGAPLTPDISPESVQSIDERISAQLGPSTSGRGGYPAPMEGDPESATSEHSQVPLVGLPPPPPMALGLLHGLPLLVTVQGLPRCLLRPSPASHFSEATRRQLSGLEAHCRCEHMSSPWRLHQPLPALPSRPSLREGGRSHQPRAGRRAPLEQCHTRRTSRSRPSSR